MIKTMGFLLLWLGGSAAAVAVAWTGVSVVNDDLIHPAPANISSVSNDDPTPPASEPATFSNLATQEPTLPETNTPSSAPTSNPQPTAAPTSQPAQTQPPQPTTTPAPAPLPTTTPAPAPTTTSTTPPPTPTSTTSSPTSTTPPPTSTTEPAQTLTFNLIGGSTAISFSPTNVQVLWATPDPGFEVKIEPESPGIKVEFRADHHRSRIDAWWSNGPQTNIREDPDN